MGNRGATPVDTSRSSSSPALKADEDGDLGASPSCLGRLKRLCSSDPLVLAYTIICGLVILHSIAIIAITVGSAITLRLFTTDLQSGRLVALVLLATTSGIGLSMVIYALIAVLKKHRKPIFAAAIVLLTLAVIQSLIVGVSLPVSPTDETRVTLSLSDSFRQARDDPKHGKTWANIQSGLSCCGVYSAEDYRLLRIQQFIVPNIPISCCPSYDSDRSEILQEREREICRARREFYGNGCNATVLDLYRKTAITDIWTTIIHIILLIIHSIFGALLLKTGKLKSKASLEESPPSEPQVVVSQKPKAKLSIT